MILNGLSNMKKLNPNYNIEISDDNDIEDYLKKNLEDEDYFNIKEKHIVEKVDLWRLLKMYNEGGIYQDFDRYCNKNFDKIIGTKTKCVLPTYLDVDFSQDIMISCKNNPLFKKAIKNNIESRKLKNKGIFDLGPVLYMQTVTEVVFGKKYNRKPGIQIMETFRDLLNESEFFQTFREEHMNYTFTFEYDKETFEVGNGKNKRDFYKEQNIDVWTNYGK